MIKKLSLFLLFCVLFLTGCTNAEKNRDTYQSIIERDKLIVGVVYDAKPFGFLDKDSELKGVDIDVAKEIAKRLLGDEDKIEFKQVSSATRIQSITTGEVDMVVATMTITPQRKLIVDFSDPYYIAGQAIVVPNSSKINSVSDLNDKSVIVVLGTTGEKNLRYFAPGAILQGYKNYSSAFNAFKKNNAEALTTDDTIIMGFLMDNQGYKILPKRLTQEPYGVAFKNSDDSKILKTKVNRIISDMKSDGTIKKIEKKWGLN